MKKRIFVIYLLLVTAVIINAQDRSAKSSATERLATAIDERGLYTSLKMFAELRKNPGGYDFNEQEFNALGDKLLDGQEKEKFFGQVPPGTEPVQFVAEIHSSALCPHGQLAFAPDGTAVFWSAIGLEDRQQTIYWSAFDGKSFSRPVVAPFATASGNGGAAFSPDGRRLYFIVEIAGPDESSPKTTGIYYVERSGSGWTKPLPIEATVDNRTTKGQVSVARNGNIYFTGRVLTEPAATIFLSRCVDGKYAPPEKLAGPIAEVPHLVDPWIDPDERFLLVSIMGFEGSPMLTDIGISRRQADGTWGQPVLLGLGINAPAFNRFASLSLDGEYLFFIRSFSPKYVGDQAHFFWVETKGIPELQVKESGLSETKRDFPALTGPYLGQEPPGMTPEIFAPGIVSSSEATEYGIAFAPDGKEFYFNRSGVGVMVCAWSDTGWTAPIKAPFLKKYKGGAVHIMYDGKRLLMNRYPGVHDLKEGETGGIWALQKTKNGWDNPVFLIAEGMRATSTLDGSIYTTDISGFRKEGKDQGIIAKYIYSDSGYQRAADPDGGVNTENSEAHPFIAPDESYIIFDSTRPLGKGRSDLYICYKDEKGHWSKAINSELCTDNSDWCATVSPDRKYLFFTRNNTGNGDIYWVDANIIEELKPEELK